MREILEIQIEQEEEQNEACRVFQELKFRKIQDHMRQKWFYEDNSDKEEIMGASEDENKRAPVTNRLKDRLE